MQNGILANRRAVLKSTAAAMAAAALGINPRNILAAEGDVLTVRMDGDLQILDPAYYAGSPAEGTILSACMPRLAVSIRNADGTWGWAPSEFVERVVQEDPMRITFALKPGLMWSNGAGELTAEDVKYSFERMLTSAYSGRWPTLDHVDVVDKHRGVVVLKSPFAGTFVMGVAGSEGVILPKSAMQKLKGETFTVDLPGQLGPYRLDSWVPKQSAILKLNPDWNGARPAFSQIIMVDIDDMKAAEFAFESRDVEVTNVGLETATRYQKTPVPNSKLLQPASPYFTWMGMNTSNPKLSDVRVRHAIQRAIDPDAILQGAYYGAAPKACGVIPEGIIGHRTSTKYSYDPEDAKSLLSQAGVSDLSLSLAVLNSEAEQVAAAQIIQANLADVGIQVDVKPVDVGVYWNLGLEAAGQQWKTLDLWIMRYGCVPDPADVLQWFTKNQIGVWNWERWSDLEFETLWTEGFSELDPQKREEIYLRMQEIMEDTGAYVWLTFDPLYYASSDRVVPHFNPLGMMQVELFKAA